MSPTPDTNLGRAFRACATAGILVGLVLAGVIAHARNLSWPLFLLTILCAFATVGLFLLAVARATGREQLVFFHDEAVAFVVVAIVAFSAGAPLALLDSAAVALASINAFGRIGCLTVGCCHGRPGRVGVRYGRTHVDAGLARHLLGVPLVPVQLIESWVVAVILVALVPLAASARPGTAFVTWLAAYGGTRYCLEFLRGDTWRPSFAGRTHAQWTAVARLWIAVVLTAAIQPARTWWFAAVALAVSASCVTRVRPLGRVATAEARDE